MGEVILKIENGTKKFKNELIFQNVSMEFEKGNSYGFVGPNGCGKSVFFKTLCGYSLLTEGQVIYRGKIIGKEQDFIDDAGIIDSAKNCPILYTCKLNNEIFDALDKNVIVFKYGYSNDGINVVPVRSILTNTVDTLVKGQTYLNNIL